jgi:hypothetical protein
MQVEWNQGCLLNKPDTRSLKLIRRDLRDDGPAVYRGHAWSRRVASFPKILYHAGNRGLNVDTPDRLPRAEELEPPMPSGTLDWQRGLFLLRWMVYMHAALSAGYLLFAVQRDKGVECPSLVSGNGHFPRPQTLKLGLHPELAGR